MKGLFAVASSVFIGLTAGNFLWQAMVDYEWAVAAERSFFQFIVIAVLTGLLASRQKRSASAVE